MYELKVNNVHGVDAQTTFPTGEAARRVMTACLRAHGGVRLFDQAEKYLLAICADGTRVTALRLG